MARFAMASLMFAPVFAFATGTAAQGIGELRFASVPAQLDRDSQVRAQAMLHAQELRRAWLAAGQPAEPPPDSTSTCDLTPGGKNEILTPKLNVATPPAAPQIQVQVENCPAAGFSSIYLYLYSVANPSQYIYVYYGYNYFAPPVKKDTLKIQNTNNSYPSGVFSPFSIPGVYELQYGYIYDRKGNYHVLDQATLVSLFPSTTVKLRNAQKPDGNAPMFLSGTIVTPKVSKSSSWPAFEAKMKVSDDVSGLRYSYVYICPPAGSGASCLSYTNDLPSPLLNGTVTDYDYLCNVSNHNCNHVPKGTWTINGYGGCDVVNNCFYTYDPAEIATFFGGVASFAVKP